MITGRPLTTALLACALLALPASSAMAQTAAAPAPTLERATAPTAPDAATPAPAAPKGPRRADLGPELEVPVIGGRAKNSSVGLIMRPEVCLTGKDLCANAVFTVGIEARYGWAGFAIRGGTGPAGTTAAALDLRAAWDFEVLPRFWLTPFTDLTCTILYTDQALWTLGGGPRERLALRLGLRLALDVFPTLTVFFEPVAVDWAFLVGKAKGMESSMGFAFGALTRF